MFALLLAARDIGAELLFRNGASVAQKYNFALLVCGTIGTLGFFIRALDRHQSLSSFREKFRRSDAIWRSFTVGVAAAIVYVITFQMIGTIGSGVFDLFDYGLAPILTAVIGVVCYSEKFSPRLVIVFSVFCCGLILILSDSPRHGLNWVWLASLSPLFTAVADGLTKWLLNEGGFTRSEVLSIRFLPATFYIAIVMLSLGYPFQTVRPTISIPLAIFCGFLPLWLLCTGLGRAALTKFAVWECLIPAAAFICTLPLHPENQNLTKITGAFLIVFGIISHEAGFHWFRLRR
jgi:drug/metabolite transporter (DMT)-like permease